MSDLLAASPVTRAVGLALLQFLWQGALIGAVTALLLMAFRRAAPHTRYLIACLALVALFATPLVTIARGLPDAAGGPVARVGLTSADISRADLTRATAAGDTLVAPVAAPRPGASLIGWLDRQLPLVVLLWSGGVLALTLQLLRGWGRIRRIRRRATRVATGPWATALADIAARLGVTRPIALVQSTLVDVPAVMGLLRPAIVLPISALAGLSPAHIDAILAHELAHIRRGDYLVNVAQCVVEVLLFYHPVVWWVSDQIRVEREHCCDDLAAEVLADRIGYARALASLEELRANTPRLAMAATGGRLLHRIRRLLELPPAPAAGAAVTGPLAMCVVLTVVLVSLNGRVAGHPAPPQGVPVPQPSIVPGSVTGTVTDPLGGVIPGATVTITPSETKDGRTAVTNSAGSFALPDLKPGLYDLTATLQGFKTFKKEKLLIGAGMRVTADVHFELGALSESIEVKRSAGSTAPAPSGPEPSPLVTAADYFAAAKWYYRQGRLAEAEPLTTLAVQLFGEAHPEQPAPVFPARPGVARIGGDITEPQRTQYLEPYYPDRAVASHTTGSVLLEAVIATNGTLKNVKPLSGTATSQSLDPFKNASLFESAIGALRQWLYTPAKLDGRPVEVMMNVSVTFMLR